MRIKINFICKNGDGLGIKARVGEEAPLHPLDPVMEMLELCQAGAHTEGSVAGPIKALMTLAHWWGTYLSQIIFARTFLFATSRRRRRAAAASAT